MFYKIYKILFRVLTGKTISFGNFCLIPKAVLDRIVNQPDLWNNIPSTITRSNFPIKKIESERGKRYQGKSKMNFSSLFVLCLYRSFNHQSNITLVDAYCHNIFIHNSLAHFKSLY